MAAAQGTVRVHVYEQAITFRVDDCGIMTHSLPLRRLAEQGLAAGAKAVRVDLRHCTYMDSTFIGTLLCLQRACDCRGQGALALISPSPQCCQLLKQMGIEHVFRIELSEERAGISWTELSAAAADVAAFKRNVVQAHQELASLPGAAGEPFRWLGRRLTEELEAEKAK
jgi:anti-anti-sigma factor